MSSTPLGTTQVTITWEAADVQSWATEYDERYQVIGQEWLDLWNDVANSLSELAETYGPVAEDLIQQEKSLNEEMWGRAIGYIGQAITFDDVPLAEICPFYAVDLKQKKLHELFQKETILDLAAKAGTSLNKPQVMTTVTFDITAMAKWAESSIQRYADIDRAYHEALETAFWDDVSTVEAFFEDIATQIRETTTLISVPAPKTMLYCDYKPVYHLNEEQCLEKNGTFTQHTHYGVCDLWFCRPDSLEQFLEAYVEEAVVPAVQAIGESFHTRFNGDLEDELREFAQYCNAKEEELKAIIEMLYEEYYETEASYAEDGQALMAEAKATIKEYVDTHQGEAFDVEAAWAWILQQKEDIEYIIEEWESDKEQIGEAMVEAREEIEGDVEDATKEFWAVNGDEITAKAEGFVSDVKEIVVDMAGEIEHIWEMDVEHWQDEMANPGTPGFRVKAVPTTSESSYGVAIGAGVCALAIGAFALFKKSKKGSNEAKESLLVDEEYEKV